MTQAVTDEFDERNVVLFMALGFLSYARAGDRLLPALVPARPALAGADDELTLAVLGLLAVRLRAGALLETAAREPKPARADGGEAADTDIGALRDLLR